MSEMRRTARALVEPRAESFQSHYDVEASVARLTAAMAPGARHRGISRGLAGTVGREGVRLRDASRTEATARTVFEGSWVAEAGRGRLDGRFLPSPRSHRAVRAASLVIALLLAASVAVLFLAENTTLRFLVPMATVFAILGLPLFVLALGSQRLAEEARVAKAIRVALAEEEEELPPPQRWSDED